MDTPKPTLKAITRDIISILVVLTAVASSLIAQWYNLTIPTLISVAFGTVVGFFFSNQTTP